MDTVPTHGSRQVLFTPRKIQEIHAPKNEELNEGKYRFTASPKC